MIASYSKSKRAAPSCSWAWSREQCVTCTWSSKRGTSTEKRCCIGISPFLLEHMQGMEDLRHDAQRDDLHPGDQQGKGKQQEAQLDLFHESVLLSVLVRSANS